VKIPSQDFENKSGYTSNFLNIALKAWITRVNTVYLTRAEYILNVTQIRHQLPLRTTYRTQENVVGKYQSISLEQDEGTHARLFLFPELRVIVNTMTIKHCHIQLS